MWQNGHRVRRGGPEALTRDGLKGIMLVCGHATRIAPRPVPFRMLATQQIFLIAALLCFLTFLTLLSVAAERVRGMRALLLAAVLGMAGNALYAFGRELPPLLAYEAANVTYAAAGAALVAGYRRLAGRPARAARLAALVGVFGVLVTWLHYGADSFVGRSAAVSLFQAGVCAGIAHAVRGLAAPEHAAGAPRFARQFVLGMCALVALGHAGRMLWLALTGSVPGSLLQPSVWSISFLTAVALALPALAIGGLLIAHRQIVQRAEYAANHDHLTGAWSRKGFFEIAGRELARRARGGTPLALLLIDLDNFKTINDECGHDAGDAALCLLVETAGASLRAVDCLARLGGDEFVLLLPETSLPGAAAVAERLRAALRQAAAGVPGLAPLSLSIGVTVVGHGEELAPALTRADAALYDAKQGGRDRVATRPPAPQPVAAPSDAVPNERARRA
nr:GGDEF domain [uncultured organism]